MDGAKYKAILEGHMLPFATNTMAPDWKMFQDNDSKHRCSLMIGKLKKLPDGRKFRTFGWFKLNRVNVIKSPPYSPDLNPIENLFSIVKKKLRGRRFTSDQDLFDAASQAWNTIPIDMLINLVDSMPDRINAVIEANGWQTKY